MSFKFSKNSLKVLSNVHIDLQTIFKTAIKESPIDFGIPSTGGLRSAEMQNKLFLDKKSKADGYKRKSYHQTGNAVDIYAYVNGKVSYEKAHLILIAGVIKSVAHNLNIKLTWGGDWNSFIDMPHFQIEKK